MRRWFRPLERDQLLSYDDLPIQWEEGPRIDWRTQNFVLEGIDSLLRGKYWNVTSTNTTYLRTL